MSKSQEDMVMIIERGSTLIFDRCVMRKENISAEQLGRVTAYTGCEVVAIPRDALMGVIPPKKNETENRTDWRKAGVVERLLRKE